jgi:hypothetical protein
MFLELSGSWDTGLGRGVEAVEEESAPAAFSLV